MQFRVGLGHDTHRLVPKRRFVLGGVEVAFELGPEGHSDGDVLLHAVTDALLGAAGLGDIGQWFPPNDPQWKDCNSATFVRKALELVRGRGWQLVNLDCTVFAERPRLSDVKPAIRQRLAELLEVRPEQVNVKAKSGEGVGPIGRQEAIAADAVVMLVRTEKTRG